MSKQTARGIFFLGLFVFSAKALLFSQPTNMKMTSGKARAIPFQPPDADAGLNGARLKPDFPP